MKTKITVSVIAALMLFSSGVAAAPLGTAFTYQGRLTSGANVANGTTP